MSFVKVQHSDSHFLSGNLHSLWKNFLLRCAYAFPRSKASSAHFWLLFLASCAMTMSRLFVHSAPPRLFSFSCIDRTARVCWYVVSGEQGRFLRVFSRPLPSSRRPSTHMRRSFIPPSRTYRLYAVAVASFRIFEKLSAS